MMFGCKAHWCDEVNAFVGVMLLDGKFVEVRMRHDAHAGPNGITVLAKVIQEYELGDPFPSPEVEIEPAQPVSKAQPDYWDGRKRAYEH